MIQTSLVKLLRQLRPIGLFAVTTLAVLTCARLCFIAWQHERVLAADMLGTVLLQGVRFDLVLLGVLLLPVTVALPLFATSGPMLRIWRPVLSTYLVVCFALALFMELATPSFVAQFDSRPNRLFVEYLIYPKEVGSTLLAAYLYPMIGAVLFLTAAVFWFRRRLARSFAGAEPVPWLAAVAAAPLLFVACVAAGRSTLDHRAVNPSTVAVSRDPLVNDLALNSAYTVLYAVAEERGELQNGFRYGDMSDDEALERVKAAMQVEPSAFVPGDIPTLHRQTATRTFDKPKNLVLIVEESLGAEYVGALGGRPLTPRLDSLTKDGIWFTNLYATGTRSVRGLEAVTTGFTPTPAESVIKLGRSQRGFFSIARLLKARGYDTSFIYGGEAQFDNMRRFFMNNGFDFVIDEDDYVNPVFHGSWGVADEDLFTRADQEFAKPRDKPFFSLVFTTSNHSPYEYPDGRIEPYDAEPNTVNNAVRYADYSLGQFFDRARQRPYWQDTVFLVVADHNSRVFGANLIPVEHFHIPGLILGGTVEPAVYSPVASQIDLPVTLLSLIGISSEHPMIGHDLTRPEFAGWPGRAILQYNATQGYMFGNKIVILRKDLQPETFEYDGVNMLTPTSGDAALTATAIAHANWTFSAYERSAYRLP